MYFDLYPLKANLKQHRRFKHIGKDCYVDADRRQTHFGYSLRITVWQNTIKLSLKSRTRALRHRLFVMQVHCPDSMTMFESSYRLLPSAIYGLFLTNKTKLFSSWSLAFICTFNILLRVFIWYVILHLASFLILYFIVSIPVHSDFCHYNKFRMCKHTWPIKLILILTLIRYKINSSWFTVSHRSEFTPHIFVNILFYLFMWQHRRNDTLLQCKVVIVQLV